MRKNKKGIVRKITGVFLLFLGLLGAILPILPGFIFFFLGLSMINRNFSKDLQKIVSRYKCHKDKIKLVKEVLKAIRENFLKKK
ncbi:MAG: hypothetical protein HXL16_06145 [Peptostreptococcaceae bacterium]|nr:hypothetical protein [Peptostreptococcaceae bacterium]